MWQMPMFEGMSESTSSPVSADGTKPCVSPNGLPESQSGQVPAPVSHSAQPEGGAGRLTPATYGRSSDASLRSASLQFALENRLRQMLDVNGSPEYGLTWKHWDMQSGPPICALRASALRISDSACTGWRTPAASDWEGGAMDILLAKENGYSPRLKVRDQVQIAGWPTPTSRDWRGGANIGEAPVNSLLGRQVLTPVGEISGYLSKMAGTGALNPAFHCWLMGYSPEILRYAEPETP